MAIFGERDGCNRRNVTDVDRTDTRVADGRDDSELRSDVRNSESAGGISRPRCSVAASVREGRCTPHLRRLMFELCRLSPDDARPFCAPAVMS
jgi:hypothetical protein